MFTEVKPGFNFCEIEKKIRNYWHENNVFEKSVKNRNGREVYCFYDGPPTANGKPHIGHILTRAIKDLIPRYKTMKGYLVTRKAGWDTHGLPVELEVEKELGLDGKEQIEIYGIEKFINKCKESVWKYKSEWENMSECVGFWADMKNPYVTYENKYIESVWWALKKIWDKNLIYNGFKVVPYCPRCGTALSSHEVAQGYKDVKEKSLIASFKIKNKDNEYFLAWTTTPWTLPSNVALVVNPNEKYARVEYKNKVYVVCSALADKIFVENYKILDEIIGKELEGMEYEPLFNYDLNNVARNKKNNRAFCVLCDDYVTLTDGTGIVHCSPAFGEDDARVGIKNNLIFSQPVNERGCFKENMGDLAGKFVKDADEIIIKKLDETGKLFACFNYEHSYPFCWRCDTPLLYYARNSWFIKMTEVRDKLVKNNNKINWYPDNIKQGRFGNFLENVVDWGLSRERYWGTPLPIWQCECGYEHMIGSVEELKNMCDDDLSNLELHKPFIDKVFLNCPKCKKKMKRVSEVIDCWFDSGSMPFAQWHYPFENKDLFENNFPADFISEAVDQTRGWFYTLLAISTLLFDREAYKNVIVLGHVQDKYGKKMSKHKGNVVSPWEVLDNYGADVIRWYFYSNSAPYLPNKFDFEDLKEIQRKFINTLWNVYSFFVLYANIDNFDINNYESDLDLENIMDKWIMSKLNNLIESVDNFLGEYKITEASRLINIFVDELSNWYVRRSRERFWAGGMEKDKINAYKTLYKVLVELVKLCAPFIPFMTEEIFINLTKRESVHLEDYPVVEKKLIDKELEENMDLVLKIVELGRSARNNANIKNRQPIRKIFVKLKKNLDDEYKKIILDELNIKEIEVMDDNEIYFDKKFVDYNLKPNLKNLGKKCGKYINKIRNVLIEKKNDFGFIEELKNGIDLDFDNDKVKIFYDDVLIEKENKSDFVVSENKNILVVLDKKLDDDLIEEGFVREIISKVQNMRKEAKFDVMDKIIIYYDAGDFIKKIFLKYEDLLKKETLANEIINGNLDGYVKEWNINNEQVEFGVKKI